MILVDQLLIMDGQYLNFKSGLLSYIQKWADIYIFEHAI